jgi:GNAT superfamily N-acetyltransferase
MQLSLRAPAASDLPLIAQMNRRLIEDEGSRNPMTVAQLEERLRGWQAEGYVIRLFVDSEARVLGYDIFCVLPDDHYPDRSYVYLRQFYVERDVRRRKVGARALALLRDEFPAEATVALDVLTSNPGGQAFWARMGFAPCCTTLHLPATQR